MCRAPHSMSSTHSSNTGLVPWGTEQTSSHQPEWEAVEKGGRGNVSGATPPHEYLLRACSGPGCR